MIQIPWTQIFVGLNGALVAASTGVVFLDVSDTIKAAVVFMCSILLAFVAPFLPKVSAGVRRTMNLQKRG